MTLVQNLENTVIAVLITYFCEDTMNKSIETIKEVKIGNRTFTNCPADYFERVQTRYNNNIPFADADDEIFETFNDLRFKLNLSLSQQAHIKSEPDMLKRRHLAKQILEQNLASIE